MRSSIALFTAALLTLGCGAAPSFPTTHDFPSEHSFVLRESESGPEVAALMERFWASGNFDSEALRSEAEALLGQYPGNAELHEMLAQIAELRADDDSMWFHYASAAADLRTPFTIAYLSAVAEGNMTAREANSALSLLRDLGSQHPRGDVRAFATDARIRLLKVYGRREEARTLAGPMGYIRTWKIIGSFDNDQGKGFEVAYAPEESVDYSAEAQGVLLPVRWRDATLMDDRGRVLLGAHMQPNRWAVAYMNTYVHSDTARPAELRFRTTTSVRAWFNDTLVASEEHIGGGTVDNLIVPVNLKAGWNALLIKSASRNGNWNVAARLTDEAGAALSGLRYSTGPEQPASDSDETRLAPTPRYFPDGLEDVVPVARREWHTYRHKMRVGFDRDALEAAQRMLAHAQGNPVAVYYAAMAHWDDDEMGRAIDLLNQGVDAAGDWSAAMLTKRGRFYRQRERWDRAIEDMRSALELNPRARGTRMDLASAYAARGWRVDECRVLEEILREWPDSAWAAATRGSCLEDRGYYDQAEEWFERARALMPGYTSVLGHLVSRAEQRADWSRALELVGEQKRLYPWSPTYLVRYADLLRSAGRRDEARTLYEHLLVDSPEWSKPHRRLAIMANEDGDMVAALENWQAALARNPDDSRLAERVEFFRSQDSDEGTGGREHMPSEEDIETHIARAAELEPAAGAHTVMLLDDEVTMVQGDGSAQHMVTQVWQAVTTQGRDYLINQRIPAEARVLAAYSRGADGERQEASSIRNGDIRFRGLDLGSIVVIQYIYHQSTFGFLPNHFVSSWSFQGVHRQTLEARWLIMLPEHRELSMHIEGPVQHATEQRDGMTVYSFRATNVPPLIAEPLMVPPSDLIWSVQVSTLPNWDEYVAWERALLSEVFETDRELQTLAQRLTENAESVREKLDHIYHYVAQEIRYQQDYESTIAGVRPHSAPIVLERGYGDCKDKAVLFILLAREVGIDVHFAILRTTDAGKVRQEVPNQQFNHAIVYVPEQDGIASGFFMDPTTDGLDMGNLRDDDQGAISLVLNPEGGAYSFMTIPYQAPEFQRTENETVVTIQSAEQATAHSVLKFRGTGAAGIRRAMRNREQASNLFQAIATTLFTGARLQSSEHRNQDDIWHPLELEVELDIAASIQAEGSHHRIAIPEIASFNRLTSLETRRTPMRLGAPDSRNATIRFELPRGARVVRTPEDFELSDDCFTIRQRTRRRGRTITVEQAYERRCPEISTEQYPALRSLTQRAQNQFESHLVFSIR